jgi:hypothetical protein
MLIRVCLRILASSRIPRYDLGRQTPHFWGGSVTTGYHLWRPVASLSHCCNAYTRRRRLHCPQWHHTASILNPSMWHPHCLWLRQHLFCLLVSGPSHHPHLLCLRGRHLKSMTLTTLFHHRQMTAALPGYHATPPHPCHHAPPLMSARPGALSSEVSWAHREEMFSIL